jgi:hypothetical protein
MGSEGACVSKSESVPASSPAVATAPVPAPTPVDALPTDPAELEAHIERTRARLVGTVDELATRLQPKEIARRGAIDLRARINAVVRTPDGSIRVERLAAIAAALATVASLIVWNRRRLRH